MNNYANPGGTPRRDDRYGNPGYNRTPRGY
jgi:hypothetical protein